MIEHVPIYSLDCEKQSADSLHLDASTNAGSSGDIPVKLNVIVNKNLFSVFVCLPATHVGAHSRLKLIQTETQLSQL